MSLKDPIKGLSFVRVDLVRRARRAGDGETTDPLLTGVEAEPQTARPSSLGGQDVGACRTGEEWWSQGPRSTLVGPSQALLEAIRFRAYRGMRSERGSMSGAGAVREIAIGVRPGRAKEVCVFKRIAKILPAVGLATGLACGLATGAAWAAESPFIGAWKLDPAKTRMPDGMKVERAGGDKYAFDFGGEVETVVVDGSDQPGGYGGTVLSVKPEAPDTWIVERKQAGRLLIKATWKLSKDGRTLTDYFRQFDPDGSTLSMDYVYRRAGSGSGFAGDWRSIKETLNSPYTMQVTAFQGDGLSFIMTTAKVTKNVKFDGQDYPKAGPNAGRDATASARRVDARTLMITDKAAGKVSDTEEVGLSADLKTLTLTVHIPGRDAPNVMVFRRI